MDAVPLLAEVSAYGADFWAWLTGPFWKFMNAPFIAGLIPALVGVLLARRVREVADTNRDAERTRSAEAQVQEIDREVPVAEAAPAPLFEDLVSAPSQTQYVAPSQKAAASDVSLSDEQVQKLRTKIDQLKFDIDGRIKSLDGRRRKKYDSITRYDYRPIVLMLADDGAINGDDRYRLIEIFSAWSAHSKRRTKIPNEKAEAILSFAWTKPRTVPRKKKKQEPSGEVVRSTDESQISS